MDKWERCDGYDGTEQIAVCPCCQAAAEEIERLRLQRNAALNVIRAMEAQIERLQAQR
jgi:hypothetical protein